MKVKKGDLVLLRVNRNGQKLKATVAAVTEDRADLHVTLDPTVRVEPEANIVSAGPGKGFASLAQEGNVVGRWRKAKG